VAEEDAAGIEEGVAVVAADKSGNKEGAVVVEVDVGNNLPSDSSRSTYHSLAPISRALDFADIRLANRAA